MPNKYTKETKNPFCSCEYIKTQGYKMDNLHWHIYYEVLFIRKAGKYTVFNSGNAHDGNIPQIYIHRPYTPHKIIIDSSERYERYILYVYRSTLRNFSEDLLDLSIFEKACMLSITPTEEEAEWYTAQC